MKTYLCTLHDAIMEAAPHPITLSGTLSTVDKPYLFGRIPEVSRKFCERTNKEFEPILEIRPQFPRDMRNFNPRRQTLRLDAPLLALTSVTVGDTPLTVGADIDVIYNGDEPYTQLQLKTSSCLSLFQSTCAANSAAGGNPTPIEVTGWWGYKSRYATDGWKSTEFALTVALDIGDTTFTDPDWRDADEDGIAPRFSPGMLLRVEDELLRVIAIDETTNVISVLRAQRGTEEAVHSAATTVYRWNLEDDVRQAVYRWVGIVNSRRNVYDSAIQLDMGIIRRPADAPPETEAVIERYAQK